MLEVSATCCRLPALELERQKEIFLTDVDEQR